MEKSDFEALKKKASLEAIAELKEEYKNDLEILKKLEKYEEEKDNWNLAEHLMPRDKYFIELIQKFIRKVKADIYNITDDEEEPAWHKVGKIINKRVGKIE